MSVPGGELEGRRVGKGVGVGGGRVESGLESFHSLPQGRVRPPGALDLNLLSVSQPHTLLPTLGLSNLLGQRGQITPVLLLYPTL